MLGEGMKSEGLDSDLIALWERARKYAKRVITPMRAVGWALISKAAKPTREEIERMVFRDWLAYQWRLDSPFVDFASPALILKPGTQLPPDHYIVRVAYGPLPGFESLQRQFEENVSEAFDGRPWEIDDVCAGISTVPGRRLFWDVDPPTYIGRDQISLSEWAALQRSPIAPFGWRHATHTEAYEFLSATLKKEFSPRCRVAMGDQGYTATNNVYFAAFSYDHAGILEHVVWSEERGDWRFEDARFLLVAKRPGETYDGVTVAD